MNRHLNKKVMIASLIGITFLFIMVFMNYVGKNNIQEPLPVLELGTNDTQEPLPVLKCTTMYPDFMLSDLAEHSDNIVNAQVVSVGETIIKPVNVNLSEVPSDIPDDTLYYPVTPVYLKVIDSIKGDVGEEYVYYEEGGTAPTYIQLPSGYKMETEMNVILFLNDRGYGWGEQSIYPVIGNKVLLKSDSVEELNNIEISSMPITSVPDVYRRQISVDSLDVCNLDDFIDIISSYTN